MTEAEWLTATDPEPMLQFLEGKGSDRKLRLFAVACCRRIWDLIGDARSQEAVEAAERFGDAKTNAERRAIRVARAAAVEVQRMNPNSFPLVAARASVSRSAFQAALRGSNSSSVSVGRWPESGFVKERAAQSHLLRDIFGNPFRPVTSDPSWLTSTVVALAEGIYADRAFDRLPILADALQDAGCDNADVLDHCRGPGPHVRGCWVVDLLLGKT